MEQADLGFSYRQHADGGVLIHRHGKIVTRLRGAAARKFMSKVAACGPDEVQQLMARATGSYRFGNERMANHHPRNSR